MGAIWAAHHVALDRDVAIKIPDANISSRPDIRERFFAEARALGRLRHPNIVDVTDFGETDEGRLYLVFELLDGMTLAQHIEQLGALSEGSAVRIAIEVCRGLRFAHAAGIVHRDLKPGNVFLHHSPNGGTVVKILDFGISKAYDAQGVSLSLTSTGAVLGTPLYMSVEQARGSADVDCRSDIWSLGVVLYEMLTGKTPFEAGNYNATLDRIVHDKPPPMLASGLTIHPELEAIVMRCLHKDPDDRFQCARDLREALESVLASVSDSSGMNIERMSGILPSMRPDAHIVITPQSGRSTSANAVTLDAPPSCADSKSPLVVSTAPSTSSARPSTRPASSMRVTLVMSAIVLVLVAGTVLTVTGRRSGSSVPTADIAPDAQTASAPIRTATPAAEPAPGATIAAPRACASAVEPGPAPCATPPATTTPKKARTETPKPTSTKTRVDNPGF
ncbi:MAG: protein kinase [Deltaproteobacteria bacterium]|nr:protein kinase [Deltaproteobacteria bacterium]